RDLPKYDVREATPVSKVSEQVTKKDAKTGARYDAAEQEAKAILAVIRALPESYREPLMLRLVEGMTGPEIAARTGLTHGSVRVNLYRGMQLLRKELAGTARGASWA